MREIEFRGKRVEDDKWIYGYYRYVEEHYANPNENKMHFITSKNNGIDYKIDRNTLSQYTGIKDKNGTKIFEGDIVKVDNKHIDIVVYASGCFCMDRQIMNYEFTYQDFKSIEVICNIYDNPKLLEVDNA